MAVAAVNEDYTGHVDEEQHNVAGLKIMRTKTRFGVFVRTSTLKVPSKMGTVYPQQTCLGLYRSVF